MRKRNVYIDEAPPDDGERYVNVPKGNDRMFSITLFNLRRGINRKQTGTATVWRLRALFDGIAKRYPEACKSPPNKQTLMVRVRRAGRVVMIVVPLEGPTASAAVKQ